MISSIPDITKAAEGMSSHSHSHIPTQMPSFPRDLLQNFINGTHLPRMLDEDKIAQEDAELELTLGLSLNGRFGVDPTPNNDNLSRSSSIPDFLQLQPSPVLMLADNGTTEVSHACEPISRASSSSSLPMETEDDECRKRKAMHSLRRMEAKRKRTEKQRSSRAFNGYSNSRVNSEGRPEDDDQKMLQGSLRDCSKDDLLKGSVDTSFRIGMPERVLYLYAKGADFTGENDNINRVASQGSGSSGVSEFERLSQGSNKCSEARSLSTLQCAPDYEPKSPTAPSGYSSNSSASTLGNGQADFPVPGSGGNGVTRDVLMELPCVSTVGDGPDGKKIEGFLYRYKKGEEVKIVCVCHGRFLSPAEFVKHAGGADVSNPLKHIVVNVSPFLQ